MSNFSDRLYSFGMTWRGASSVHRCSKREEVTKNKVMIQKYFTNRSRCWTRFLCFFNSCVNRSCFHPISSSRIRCVYAKTLASNNPGLGRLKKNWRLPNNVDRASNALPASASKSLGSMYCDDFRSSSRAACCSWRLNAERTAELVVAGST